MTSLIAVALQGFVLVATPHFDAGIANPNALLGIYGDQHETSDQVLSAFDAGADAWGTAIPNFVTGAAVTPVGGAVVCNGIPYDCRGPARFNDGGLVPYEFTYGVWSAVDFTGDGYSDYADRSIPNGTFWIHANLQNSSFSSSTWLGANPSGTSSTPSGWEQLLGDFDGDGFADFADHFMPTGEYWVHRNLQNGSFTSAAWYYGVTPTHNGDPAWEYLLADFDNDNKVDLVEHYRPTGAFYVHKGAGDGSFAGFGQNLATGSTTVGRQWFMGVGDIDCDGYADVFDVKMGDDAGVRGYLNNKQGGFGQNVVDMGAGSSANETELLIGPYTGSKCASMMIHHLDTGTAELETFSADTSLVSCGFNQVCRVPTGTYHANAPTSVNLTSYYSDGWETLGAPHRVSFHRHQGINYSGGFVQSGNHNIYVVIYGQLGGHDLDVIGNFLSNISGTTLFNVEAEYNDLRGAKVDNSYYYKGAWVFDGGSPNYQTNVGGGNCDTSTYWSAVSGMISGGTLPLDPNGVYILVTGKDISGEPCACGCGIHTPYMVGGTQLQFVAVNEGFKNPSCADSPTLGNDPSGYACGIQSPGPNGYPDGGGTGGDALVNWISHELWETLSDPGFPGYDGPWPSSAWSNVHANESGNENADNCQYMYANGEVPSPTYGVSGALYDYSNAGGNFYVQTNLTLDGGGYCSLVP